MGWTRVDKIKKEVKDPFKGKFLPKDGVRKNKPQIRITEKQKRLYGLLGETVINGKEMSKAEMMRRAGYSPTAIRGNGAEIWNAVGFRALCERGGLGMGRIKEVIEEATKAKTVVTFQGEAHESEAPDHAIRLRAAEMLAKVSGLMVDRSESVNVHMDASEALDILNLG